MDYIKFIEQVLGNASEIANLNFGKVKGTTKADDNNQVLTETDLEIGSFLVGIVRKTFPDHNIIDEETGVVDNKSDFTWVIDPIDGTSNFANGLPMYGIMIGLLDKNKPVAGGIALPYFKELYLAESGGGAFCNGEKISVSREQDLRNSLVAYGVDGHQENPEITKSEAILLGNIILNIRNLRSSNSVYDAAMVACGKYGVFMNRTSKVWDNVAQQVIIEEAGGVYTDFFGREIDYSNPLSKVENNYTFCAAPPELHKKLQEII